MSNYRGTSETCSGTSQSSFHDHHAYLLIAQVTLNDYLLRQARVQKTEALEIPPVKGLGDKRGGSFSRAQFQLTPRNNIERTLKPDPDHDPASAPRTPIIFWRGWPPSPRSQPPFSRSILLVSHGSCSSVFGEQRLTQK